MLGASGAESRRSPKFQIPNSKFTIQTSAPVLGASGAESPKPSTKMRIRYVSLCSGYGAECLAFKRLRRDNPGFDFECVAWSEIEPGAIKAHDALHPEYAGRNLGDMTVCDYSPITAPVDILFYSTPCQSVSNAGKNAGMKKGDDSAASALIWHTERAIRELKPRICILENVKGMVSKRNRPDFDQWCQVLESYGYVNFWQILNAKDFGVAQNRERVFMVSIQRTEAEPCPPVPLPQKLPPHQMRRRLHGAGRRRWRRILHKPRPRHRQSPFRHTRPARRPRRNGETLPPRMAAPRIIQVASLADSKRQNPNQMRVYSPKGISPCINAHSGGQLEPLLLTVKNNNPRLRYSIGRSNHSEGDYGTSGYHANPYFSCVTAIQMSNRGSLICEIKPK